MERKLRPILATGLIFVTLSAHASASESPNNFTLQTKYSCQANGIVVRNKDKVLGSGDQLDEVKFLALPGRNQTLTFGDRDYMIWPRAIQGTFGKSLNVLAKDGASGYKIVQEIDLGEAQKTKTSIGLTVKDHQGEEHPVSCRVEIEWKRKTLK